MARKTTATRTRTAKTTAASKPAPKPPAIRGEKRVRETAATVPVGPARRKRGMHDGPTDPVAVDRRKQFSGTDESAHAKKGKSARGRTGGNPGRDPVGLPGRV